MSKNNQIQQKIIELDGGAFQKLADAYLYRRGYRHINPLGSVVGANKVRAGTPDTYIPLDNGKYVFVEYTTQQEQVFQKLMSDLQKCFDESKIGIPVDNIAEIVFCHTTTLTPEEHNALMTECQKNGINLNIFGIGPISNDLYQKYPAIAKDFLGVEVDTGQILTLDEFVDTYNKNKLATPLDTTFHFREEDLKKVGVALESSNIVILSGHPGVGKSRLALECCLQFTKAHQDYKVRCIYNRGIIDLYQDLRTHFAEPGNYLIFVDDANRINGFSHVLQLLNEQNESKSIRILVTVRDYAIDKIRELVAPFGKGIEVELAAFNDDQIKQLIEAEFDINNHLYLDRIADISQGNPRLAIMAAKIAKRENTLQSITDVSALYDEYFTSIRNDLEELKNPDILKAAGIVAFFRHINFTNQDLMREIEEAFGITSSILFEASKQLHDLEIFDMYETEIVKFSDQVLSTYLFYLVFFKQNNLNFSKLLEYFFPLYREKFIDSINPVINAFDFKDIVSILRPHIDNKWNTLQSVGDADGLYKIMELFWYIKTTDTLVYIKNHISEMQTENYEYDKISIKPESNISPHSFLNILKLFGNSPDKDTFCIALNLLFDYVGKGPNETPQMLHILQEYFGFDRVSHLQGFAKQHIVVDTLWERTDQGKDELFSRLFIELAKHFLHTRFEEHESRRRKFTIITFHLPVTEQIIDLRKKIWDGLFQLYKNNKLQKSTIKVLENYSKSGYEVSVPEIIKNDSSEVLPFILKELDPSSYKHCTVVQDYLSLLDDHGISFDTAIGQKFQNETYKISEIITDDWEEKRNLKLSHEEYGEFKKKRIKKFFANYSLVDYQRFLKLCVDISEVLGDSHKKYQLDNGIFEVFISLVDTKPKLFIQVIEDYLSLGDPFQLPTFPLVDRLIKILGRNTACKFLSDKKLYRWQFGYYLCIAGKDIKKEDADSIYILYSEANVNDYPRDWDYLLKYRIADESIFIKVARIIVKRIDEDQSFTRVFDRLFNPHSEANKIITELFKSDFELLKKLYFMDIEVSQYGDYSCETLSRILDVDPGFLIENIDWMYSRKEWLSRYDDTRNYSILWLRDDYMNIIEAVVNHIGEMKKNGAYLDSYVEVFFSFKDPDNKETINERQDKFLENLIKNRHNDEKFIKFLFCIIVTFSYERRRKLIALLLKFNKDFDLFEKLSLEPSSWGWSGSLVPMYQKRIEFLESIIPLVNTVELLQHKQYIERKIEYLRREIESEKKRDFIDEF